LKPETGGAKQRPEIRIHRVSKAGKLMTLSAAPVKIRM
jgi:hypothetical protein